MSLKEFSALNLEEEIFNATEICDFITSGANIYAF